MINRDKYITLSLETNIFFGRIMKEHALFLEAGFTPKNKDYSKEAEFYKNAFERLLCDTVKLSDERIRGSVLDSGEVFTQFTFRAERKTEFYTGIDINSNITLMEKELDCKKSECVSPKIAKCVREINCRALKLLDGFIDFKMRVLKGMLCCNLFTVNYPLLIEHIIREAKLYRCYIQALEGNKDISKEDIRKTELFWNRIMMEHSLFIRGLLDPCENDLVCTSNKFANEFCELLEKATEATDKTIDSITNETLKETTKLRDFKAAATQGIAQCEIRSIILPLLGDHVLREANHYIRLLEQCK